MVAEPPALAIREAVDGTGNYWDKDGIAGKYWDDLAEHPGCEPRAEYTANTDIFNVTLDMSKTPPELFCSTTVTIRLACLPMLTRTRAAC